jgi:hypothetical protein
MLMDVLDDEWEGWVDLLGVQHGQLNLWKFQMSAFSFHINL